jgi:Tripartite ATP-independent periplasmic transporter, DctM component
VARAAWRDKLRAVAVNIVPMSVVVFMVVGLIVLGVATPSEAAAFGVLGVLILAAAFRLLTWKAITLSLESTVRPPAGSSPATGAGARAAGTLQCGRGPSSDRWACGRGESAAEAHGGHYPHRGVSPADRAVVH